MIHSTNRTTVSKTIANHPTCLKHIGIDDHKDTLAIAVASDHASQARFFANIANRPDAITKAFKQLAKDGSQLVCYYEAGPCGYTLHRQLTAMGHACHVVAPSLTPRRAGHRVKTDRRDCINLAQLGRAGELADVWVPDTEHEAMRDLTRLREDALIMQRRARQQLSAFLLRQGRHYDPARNKWTQIFMRWLDTLSFDSPITHSVFQQYVQMVHMATAQLQAIEKQITDTIANWQLKPVVDALISLRGVDVVTAITVLSELGDLRRFDSPRQLMAYLGLVPSEHSTGSKTQRGPITKTGNRHVRRVLVEGAWSYRHRARMTAHMKRKNQNAPAIAQTISWQAQQRLCKRYRHLVESGKHKNQVTTAIARELSGFIWAIACACWPASASCCASADATNL